MTHPEARSLLQSAGYATTADVVRAVHALMPERTHASVDRAVRRVLSGNELPWYGVLMVRVLVR